LLAAASVAIRRAAASSLPRRWAFLALLGDRPFFLAGEFDLVGQLVLGDGPLLVHR